METETILLKANAKVNLTLDVKFKRPDGYHELEGIMQEISLADEVRIKKCAGLRVSFDTPVPENNTCRRAAELFLGDSGFGAEIEVRKLIPSEAGLGGASADAAAVLRGLNRLYENTPLRRTEEELFDMGLKVGADVPFCLMGGCAVARGVGERLTKIGGLEMPLLIVRGPRGVSTGKLFSSLGVGAEERSRLPEGNLKNALKAIEKKDAAKLASHLANALAPAACELAPEIGEYVERMKTLGALGASMTGSGAAVFGIFESVKAAREALERFGECDFKAVCGTMK